MTYPATLTFDPTLFRQQFPFFANETTYPDATLLINWTIATSYLTSRDCGILRDKDRQLGLNLMTAHITTINDMIIADNNTPTSLIVSSRIDKIAVTAQPPPSKDGFQWWLNLTSYGQALNALLRAATAGGYAIGGSFAAGTLRRFGLRR